MYIFIYFFIHMINVYAFKSIYIYIHMWIWGCQVRERFGGFVVSLLASV